MGIDPALLPKHIQDQIKRKDAAGQTTEVTEKAKAVPQDSTMNKTERNYSKTLEALKMSGEIQDWQHEPFNLRLAPRTFYKPDFAVLSNGGYIEIHEVKGYAFRDDALVKIKVAAKLHPWFTFVAAFWKDRQWTYRRFS